MTFEERQLIARDLFDKSLGIIMTKGREYAGEHDSLDNFKRNAERLGLTKYQIWGVYFNKHIDSVNSAIARNPKQPIGITEQLEDRILDIVTYASILLALLKEDIIAV